MGLHKDPVFCIDIHKETSINTRFGHFTNTHLHWVPIVLIDMVRQLTLVTNSVSGRITHDTLLHVERQ